MHRLNAFSCHKVALYVLAIGMILPLRANGAPTTQEYNDYLIRERVCQLLRNLDGDDRLQKYTIDLIEATKQRRVGGAAGEVIVYLKERISAAAKVKATISSVLGKDAAEQWVDSATPEALREIAEARIEYADEDNALIVSPHWRLNLVRRGQEWCIPYTNFVRPGANTVDEPAVPIGFPTRTRFMNQISQEVLEGKLQTVAEIHARLKALTGDEFAPSLLAAKRNDP